MSIVDPFSALPITIIVDNFIKVAQEEQQTEQFKAELLAMEEQERKVEQEQEQLRQKFGSQQQKEPLLFTAIANA